ncbi:redoxin domain-containing protein [Winogradskyella sp. 3972H.M.0a.05]|uniref:peroxiredoxin family protein n=1 Tax=Winogradskyella sp. 3972H.M.0a.05 TaxID=2950277 RepID=UPI00339853E4
MIFKIFALTISFLLSVNTFCQDKKVQFRKAQEEKYKAILKENEKQRKEIDGSTLTELSFEDIEGNKHTLSSLKGKVVVMNFWFIQCKPCVEEFPDLNKLKAKFEGKPVEFFAVAWNDKKSLTKFLETHQLDYTVVSDGKLSKRFKIPHYPYNMIIDQNGKVEYISEVLSLNIFKKIERKINKLL